jgi:hypothetical protein
MGTLEILIVEEQISDLGYFEFQWSGIQFDHGVRELAIQRVLAKASDQRNHICDGVHGVAFRSGVAFMMSDEGWECQRARAV